MHTNWWFSCFGQGEVEFRSILYVPAIAPMGKEDIVNPKTKNIRLYVKRVFISDDFDGELVRRIWSFHLLECMTLKCKLSGDHCLYFGWYSSHDTWVSSKVLWIQMTFPSMSHVKFFKKVVL